MRWKKVREGEILKRDRYASLSCALFLLLCSLYDCSFSFSTSSYFFLFSHLCSYILGRSFHPLELPLRCTVDARVYYVNSCRREPTFIREEARARARRCVCV